MSQQTSQSDIPVDVKGYETDPVRRGWQILYNYESTYWRALVGSEAWSLYEVLRSFCHKGNDTCKPSINLLAAILGYKDRKAITGRVKRTKNKTYKYPGLIEILQKYDLVVAEEVNQGAKLRYRFHVNLTPEQLTSEQLEQLPAILQKKHGELLKRCEAAKDALQAKRRPSRVEEGGSGNSTGGSGNSTGGLGKFHNKQHPDNNTQKTVTTDVEKQAPEESNNLSDNNSNDVVVALREWGISKRVSEGLARRYSQERVMQKIDYLKFLLESDATVRSKAGWLRKAIEEDYAPPNGYKTAEERAREEQEKIEAQEAAERRFKALEAQQRVGHQTQENQRIQAISGLRESHNMPRSEWVQLDEQWVAIYNKLAMQGAAFKLHLTNSQLIALTDEQVIILVANEVARQWLAGRLAGRVSQAIQQHLGDEQERELQFITGDPPNEPETDS